MLDVVKKSGPRSTADKILAAAEKRMRDCGFHGTSFRDIAADVGIKSASVHHHFPTKEDLAVAVVGAYTERQMKTLGDPNDESCDPNERLAFYIDQFRRDLTHDKRMCLCGLLASETASLPKGINIAVGDFFEKNREWLKAVLKRAMPRARAKDIAAKAILIAATLEGALLLAHCWDDTTLFESIVRELEGLLGLRAPKKA